MSTPADTFDRNLIASGLLEESQRRNPVGPSCDCGGEERGHVQGCSYEEYYERFWDYAGDLLCEDEEVEAARYESIGQLLDERAACKWDHQRRQIDCLIDSALNSGAECVPPHTPWIAKANAVAARRAAEEVTS